jgi:hypothetical protein
MQAGLRWKQRSGHRRIGSSLRRLCHNYSFAPSGLNQFYPLPTACAVGCNLAPLRGYFEALSALSNSRSSLRHRLLRDLSRFFHSLKRWAKLERPFDFAQAGSPGLGFL